MSKFLERVLEIPVINAAKEYSTAAYNKVRQMNRFAAAALSAAEITALYFAVSAKPVLKKVAPLVQLVDKLACLILDACLPLSSVKKCSIQEVNGTLDGHDLEEIDRCLPPAFEKTSEKSLHELEYRSNLSFYTDKINTDCILAAGNRQFPAHKVLLSFHSSVFFSRFNYRTVEKLGNVVVINDVDADVLDTFLKCIYLGSIYGLDSETVVLVYELAVKYKVLYLKNLCLEFFEKKMNIKNICDMAVFAHTHEETELCEKVELFIKFHIQDVQGTDAWNNFVIAKPSIAKKFFSSVAP